MRRCGLNLHLFKQKKKKRKELDIIQRSDLLTLRNAVTALVYIEY